MYKVFGLWMWISLVAYTAVGISIIINELEPILSGLGHKVTLGTIVLLTQAVIACILMTPMWRVLWRWIPKLNDWIYPDLNGEWDVTIKSNWTRIDKLARSAAGYDNKFDILHCPVEQLPSLSLVKMRAHIVQSWMNIYIVLESDDPDTVVERSETLVVEPIQGKNGRNPTLLYMFRQRNQTDILSDEAEFYGAGKLEISSSYKNMSGVMWTNRMWRRGMNTAAQLEFSRNTE